MKLTFRSRRRDHLLRDLRRMAILNVEGNAWDSIVACLLAQLREDRERG